MNQTDLRPFLSDPAALPRTTTVLRENGLRVVLFHLKAGEEIPEHQTRGAITVHCLKGEAVFRNAAESIELTDALLISLPPGSPHSVAARQDTLLLVTVSEASH